MRLVDISRKLARDVEKLSFSSPIAYVYNPLVYARVPHEAYLERWGGSPKEVLLLGMNPGVDEGIVDVRDRARKTELLDVALVRDFVGVTGPVDQPPREHPARPISGFDCKRSEVSGSRLWGFARDRFGSAERFFERFFVVNYCPLVFMEESGKNFTPDKLRALFEACDRALARTFDELQPRHVVGVGAFATERARAALAGRDVAISTVLHPSPASPQANRGWAELAAAQLEQAGISLPRAPTSTPSAKPGAKTPRARRPA
jgi:single-strand selective monofunctional uracil DNA glycosylase